MPSSPTQQEESRVDHRAEAAKRIEWADRTPGGHDNEHNRHLREALVHSQLAVADELKALRLGDHRVSESEIKQVICEEEADRDKHRRNAEAKSSSYENGRADGHQAAVVRLRELLDRRGSDA